MQYRLLTVNLNWRSNTIGKRYTQDQRQVKLIFICKHIIHKTNALKRNVKKKYLSVTNDPNYGILLMYLENIVQRTLCI